MTVYELKKLRAVADDAIRGVKRGFNSLTPVNWGDLSCRQAAWVVTDDGSAYAEVLIEEASPDATEFRETIRCELARRGYPGVQVVTEW